MLRLVIDRLVSSVFALFGASIFAFLVLRVTPGDPARLFFNVNTMGGLISESLRLERFRTLLLTLFAASALLLSVVGIYGVMAYTVAQRTHEIGLRMALGAQRKNVMGVVIREGLTLAVAGVGLGLLGTLAVTRVLEGLLFEVTPTDPITIGAVSVLLVTVAGLAAYVPAGKATTVDPMAALRVE